MADGIPQEIPKAEVRNTKASKAWSFLKEKIPWRKPKVGPNQSEPQKLTKPPATDLSKPVELLTDPQDTGEPSTPAPEPLETTEAYNQRIYRQIADSLKRVGELSRANLDVSAEITNLTAGIEYINFNLAFPGRYEQSMTALKSVLKLGKFSPLAPALAAAIRTVDNHLPYVENQITQPDDSNTQLSIDTLSSIVSSTDLRTPEHLRSLDIMNRKMDIVAKGIRSGKRLRVLQYLHYLPQYIAEKNPTYPESHQTYAQQAGILLRETANNDPTAIVWEEVGRMLDSPNTYVGAEGYRVLGEELSKYDLDLSEMYQAWKLGSQDSLMQWTVYRNIQTIRAITSETQDPRAAAELKRDFNIKNFERYPVEMLLDQYQNRNNFSKKQILVAAGAFDHNGFLVKRDQLATFYTPAIKQDFNIRMVEFGPEEEARQVFGKYKEKYGESDEGILIVHGHKNAIASGGEKDVITTDSLIPILKGVYKSNANLLLLSCETGQAGGLGETVHNQLGVKITGPDQECNSKSFEAQTDERGNLIRDESGRLVLKVEYLPNYATGRPTQTMIYG